MSILEFNGGAVVAMTGKECVVVASDMRLGSNQLQTVETNLEKVFPLTDKTYLACSGFVTDTQLLHKTLRFHKNLFALRQDREMEPENIATFLSTILYKRRFSPWFVEPIIAGLHKDNTPFLMAFDCIGTPQKPEGFAAYGTPSESLLGACEASYRPNLGPEELFEVCSQCLMSSVDRDCYSGWGAVVHIITPTEVIKRYIKTRMD